ncbi:hypothetical protein BYT27DRAFT_7182023 [Phlegmacium glaucopus]|nr:hypothetical protein BYT27DRAFT_7182023 [Phlegmacium glaucopus]
MTMATLVTRCNGSQVVIITLSGLPSAHLPKPYVRLLPFLFLFLLARALLIFILIIRIKTKGKG